MGDILHSPAVSVVRRSLDTLGGADGPDWNAFEDTFTDDIHFHENGALPFGGHFIGKKHVIWAVKTIFGMFDDFSVETQNLFQGDQERVVGLYVNCVGRSKATGEIFATPIMERWVVRDGKIAEIRAFYYDVARVRAAYSGG